MDNIIKQIKSIPNKVVTYLKQADDKKDKRQTINLALKLILDDKYDTSESVELKQEFDQLFNDEMFKRKQTAKKHIVSINSLKM